MTIGGWLVTIVALGGLASFAILLVWGVITSVSFLRRS